MKLKYIGLGFGIQNYSCASVGADPAATGALAMLYDITDLYPGQSKQSLSMDQFKNLPSRAMWTHDVPLNFDTSATAGRVDPQRPGASSTKPFPADGPLQLWGMRSIPFLGHHFFDSKGVPTFVLDGNKGKVFLPSGKLAAADPPTNADKGREGTGAVAWLQLNAKDGAAGAKFVYRVLTVGGNSHGCANAAGQDSTSYTATYWFYG